MSKTGPWTGRRRQCTNIHGSASRVTVEQDAVGGVEVTPGPDPRIVRFELPPDQTPAGEEARSSQGDGDAGHKSAAGYTTAFSRVQVLEPEGSGLARVDRLTTQPHMELLIQHVQGTLGVPGGGKPVVFHALLDSGSGVTSISETLACELQREARGLITQRFQEGVRVQTSFGEVRAVEQ